MKKEQRMYRVMMYDSTQDSLKKKYLSTFWELGGYIGNFDNIIPVRNVEEFKSTLNYITTMNDDVHLQIWGHGLPGAPFIDEDLITISSIAGASNGHLREVWFRSCSVFQGPPGQVFAAKLAAGINASVAGHTRIISAPFPNCQSGLYAILPGQKPLWDDSDSGYSTPWAKHTTSITRYNIPDWAYVH